MSDAKSGSTPIEATGGYAGASEEAIAFHYDVGTDFYRLWLDPLLVYSAARWRGPLDRGPASALSLDEAQIAKLDFHLDAVRSGACRTLLDIGCGWGALLKRSRDRGVERAIGLTLSRDQAAYIAGQAWPGVEVRRESYEVYVPDGAIDGIVSVGAFEHFVRPGYAPDHRLAIYRRFFESCHGWLRKGGFLSLQSICWGYVDRAYAAKAVPTYVFPDSDLPWPSEVFEAANPFFDVIYAESRAEDYALTLRAWLTRLRAHKAEIVAGPGGAKVFDHFEKYLRRCTYAFENNTVTLMRFVMARRG
ncbi:MAG TPA: class I SAM-dependent methyltransferase [Vineibacter sp.]|nr:class I SAM-dependent methyltransferase [Vineibacter sp.]